MKRAGRPYLQLAPTQDQFGAYTVAIGVKHIVLGLQYETGPRRGQQLADARKAVKAAN